MITDLGKFLDPLADKLLVSAALIVLVDLDLMYGQSWIAIVIISREFAVTGLRLVLAGTGEVVAANQLGKIKTWAQIVAISALLLHNLPFALISLPFANLALWIALIFTIWSGLDYFVKTNKYLLIPSKTNGGHEKMDAEIIAVGSELLLGQINNTNGRFLSQQFAQMGINVFYHTVVGDNDRRLQQAIEIAESRANLIVFTGGLGPTKDDLTKETIARHIGKKLVFNDEALQSIEAYFKKRERPMTENNKKQALVLEGSEVLANDHGMAPGMVLSKSGITYMLLPGPPSEMEPMFLSYGYESIMNKLDKHDRIDSKVLRFFGIGEAELETVIDDLLVNQTNPTIAPLASEGEVTLRITAKDSSKQKCEELILSAEKEIMDRVGKFYYGTDNTSLIKELVKELTVRKLSIAAAESLTGGCFRNS